jgi:hypothetical protein
MSWWAENREWIKFLVQLGIFGGISWLIFKNKYLHAEHIKALEGLAMKMGKIQLRFGL